MTVNAIKCCMGKQTMSSLNEKKLMHISAKQIKFKESLLLSILLQLKTAIRVLIKCFMFARAEEINDWLDKERNPRLIFST